MNKYVFILKAWHFCILGVFLTGMIVIIDLVRSKRISEDFNSCFTEINDMNRAGMAENDLCCVLFYDRQCELIDEMEYNFSEFANNHPAGISSYKINVSGNMQLCSDYGISGFPSMIIFHRGEEKSRFMGIISTGQLQRVFKRMEMI